MTRKSGARPVSSARPKSLSSPSTGAVPMSTDTIYLDHAATTPVDPRVIESMVPYLSERFGNPSSIYQLGQESRAALDRSRAALARILGCLPAELIFTGGATESDNLALSGVAWARRLADPSG